MLQKTMHLAGGTVKLRVKAAYPERFLNLCGSHAIRFWELKWLSACEFTMALSRRDYIRLRGVMKNVDCSYRVERREGLPFFARRFCRRRVLVAGLLLCAALTVLGSFFIWDFTVEGNDAVSDEEILRALEQNGVAMGTFGLGIDSQKLRNSMLLAVPELSWISVNVSGSRAFVQVRERVAAPEIVDEETPRNVVAAKRGLVTKVMAHSGTAMVLPGTTVEQGDLLISGIYDTDTTGARVLPGMGSVQGRTWYRFTVPIAREMEQKVAAGEGKSRFGVNFGRRRVNFYGNSSSINVAGYDTINSRMRWVLPGGIVLPVTTIREERTPYSTRTVALDAQAAKDLGESILQEYLLTQLSPGGEVVSTLCTLREEESVFYVTMAAECTEEIGRSVEILQEPEE